MVEFSAGLTLFVKTADIINCISPYLCHGGLDAIDRQDVPIGQIFHGKFQSFDQIENNAFELFFLPAGSYGDGFGLMADGIDRTSELINGRTQRIIQKSNEINQVIFSFEFLANILQGQFACSIF